MHEFGWFTCMFAPIVHQNSFLVKAAITSTDMAAYAYDWTFECIYK